MTKLDALRREVAERIMGWTAVRREGDTLVGCPPARIGLDEPLAVVPDYSRDVDAAWQVVEAMQRKDYAFEALVSLEYGVPTATFAKSDSVSIAYRCLDAPEAICRAALCVLTHETMRYASTLES
jgi:hypothetical protein